MYAIVEITGVQTRVSPDERVRVPYFNAAPGQVVTYNNVLLAGYGDNIKLGTPYLNGKVEVTVLGHDREDKVYIFKKKRRKGYRRFKGHKQHYTLIQITGMEIEGFEKFKHSGAVEIPADYDFAAGSEAASKDEMIFEDADIEDEVEEVVEKPAKKSRKKTS
jgi:large subunit ribosomal protein L21